MKKYLKMTFAALSAIALNFSCLAKAPLQRSTLLLRHPHSGIRTLNNIYDRTLTPLSTEEQISFLKRAISASNIPLAEAILAGRIGKRGQRYVRTRGGRRLFTPMSDQQFEELQLFSLDDLRRRNHSNDSIRAKHKIFKLITAKFFKVANNKKQAYQTTASRIFSDTKTLDINVPTLGALINFIPDPHSKRAFVKQLLNYAKRGNDIIDVYRKIFSAIDPSICNRPASSLSVFKNLHWLQSFIREYLERALRSTNEYIDDMPNEYIDDMPLGVIKEVAPDLYNEKFFIFLKQCIAKTEVSIHTLLPRYKNTKAKDLSSNARELSPEYLNLALKEFATTYYEEKEENEDDEETDSEYVLSHVALYTDTSLDLTDVAQTLASLTQELRKIALEGIKNVNSVLHDLLLEKLQSLGH